MINCVRVGSGRPVILQHGFLGGAGYWKPVTDHLSKSYDVIVPDLPGFSTSVDEPVVTSIADFAKTMADFLDRQNVDRVDLVGHSLGSLVSLQTALDFPERVNRLVIYGGSTTAPKRRFEPVETTIARIRSEGMATVAPQIVRTWFRNGEKDPYYSICVDATKHVKPETAIATLTAISRWDIRSRLSEVEAPTLVICGDRDRSTPPEDSYEIWRSIPKASLCVVPGCAHNVHLERPELFNAILDDFLAASSPQ